MDTVLVSPGTMTKYHRLGGFDNKYLFLTVLEAGKCKIKVPADLASTWFTIFFDVFLTHPYMVESWESSPLSCVSSYMGTNHIHKGCNPMV